MYIPMRGNGRARAHGYSINTEHVDYYPNEKYHGNRQSQEHRGVPPAVAALLAVTTIQRKPQRNGRVRKTKLDIYVEPSPPESIIPPLDSLLVVDEPVEDSGLIFGSFTDNEPITFSRSSSSAALSLLLGPPDDFDDKDFCSLSVRSASSEDVPSLEVDDGASTHSWIGPNTPKITTLQKPQKNRLSPPPEDCALDHPLLFIKEKVVELLPVGPETTSPPIKQAGFLSFKSNLTASLRVLKSAAKSLSSFAPLTQPDDLLTRSILSNNPRYADEKRPRPTGELPTPALRRYLNPTTSSFTHHSQDTRCTGAIQMQTYNRNRRTRQKPRPLQQPPRTDEGDMPRPREPRENSDFLRVIVLEMNMRREGKLSDTAQGKARLVLPPRQPTKRTRIIGDISDQW